MTDDPGGGLFQDGLGAGKQGGDFDRIEPRAVHLVQSDECRPARPARSLARPARVLAGSSISIKAYVSECSKMRSWVAGLESSRPAASNRAGTADRSPRRPSASAAARSLWGEPDRKSPMSAGAAWPSRQTLIE